MDQSHIGLVEEFVEWFGGRVSDSTCVFEPGVESVIQLAAAAGCRRKGEAGKRLASPTKPHARPNMSHHGVMEKGKPEEEACASVVDMASCMRLANFE